MGALLIMVMIMEYAIKIRRGLSIGVPFGIFLLYRYLAKSNPAKK